MKVYRILILVVTILQSSLSLSDEVCIEDAAYIYHGITQTHEDDFIVNQTSIIETWGEVTSEYVRETDTGILWRYLEDPHNSNNWLTAFYMTYPATNGGTIEIDEYETTICSDAKNLLHTGNNQARVRTGPRGDQLNVAAPRPGADDYYVNYTASLRYDDKTITLCDLRGIEREDNIPYGACSSTFRAELEDISPELYQELLEAREELESIRENAEQRELEFLDQLDEASAAIQDIIDKSFDAIVPADFGEALSALELFTGLKQSISSLQEESTLISEQLQDIWTDVSYDVDTELALKGLDAESFSSPLSMTLTEVDPISGVMPVDENIAYYQSLADQTITNLRSYADGSFNRDFIFQTKIWLKTSELLQEQLEAQFISTPEEWQALTAAFERVESYIFSVVDEDFWYRDSPLTSSQREALENIASRYPDQGAVLEEELRTWRSDGMTQQRTDLLVAMEGIGEFVDATIEAEKEANLGETISGLTMAVLEGSACIAKSVAAGDFGDFYEIFVGKDICTGEQLSLPARLVTSAGLIVGSGKVWRIMATKTGLIKPAREVISLTANVFSRGKKLRYSDGEIQSLAKLLQKQCTR